MPRSRQKKGLSTAIAVVFVIPVFLIALVTMTWNIGLQNVSARHLTERNVDEISRVDEQIEVKDTVINNNKINMTIFNAGKLPVKLAKVFVTNMTDSNGWHKKYDTNDIISPGGTLLNFGTSLPLVAKNSSSYKISVITERGTSSSFQLLSSQDKAVKMNLFVSPRSIPTGQDVTVMFSVTNNMTERRLLQSVKPVLNLGTVEGPTGTVTASATLISGPTPSSEPSLEPRETVFFRWVYNIVGDAGDKINFNATLVNARQGNYITESVQVVIDSFTEQSNVALDTLGVASFSYLSVKQDNFTKIGTTGSQFVKVGFQPKAVIFFYTRQTTEGLGTGADAGIKTGVGFATDPGANNRGIAIASDDNVSTSNSGKRQSQTYSIIILSNGNPAVTALARLTSVNSTGFFLTWDQNENRQDIIHYLALGGPDLTNALASHFVMTADTSDQSVNTVGFKPDFLMFISTDSDDEVNDSPAEYSIGFASAPTARGTLGVNFEDGKTTSGSRDTYVWQRANRALVEFLDDGAGEDMKFELKSFDASGFTIDKDTPPTPDATWVHYLALKGGTYKVGSFSKPTATGLDSQGGVGFKPSGLILMSSNRISDPNIHGDGRVSFGASDGVRSGAVWFHDLDNMINTDANQRTSTNKIAVHGSRTTLQAEAVLESFQPDGFRLDWTTNNDGEADQIIYAAFGNVTLVYSSGDVGINMTNTGTSTLWVDKNSAVVFNNTLTGAVYAGIVKSWKNNTSLQTGIINGTMDSIAWDPGQTLKFYFAEPRVIPGDPSSASVTAVSGQYFVNVRLSGYDEWGRSIFRVIPLGIGRIP